MPPDSVFTYGLINNASGDDPARVFVVSDRPMTDEEFERVCVRLE